MATPQPGVFALGTRSHHHLELDLVGDPARLIPAVHEIREAATTVRGVNLVFGFGPRAWSTIAPDHVPPDLVDFEPVVGADGYTFPATQHDVWVWLHAGGPDAVFDVARLTAMGLAGIAEVRAEQPAFTYQASQDLTGFEDGTENPPLDEAPQLATVPDGQPGAGGSIVLLQRWVHDLDGFEALELEDREKVFGRTLHGSEELDDERTWPRAHIKRVVIEDDEGEELEVFRRSTAFGGVQEHGLMFVAFSADRVRLRRMLERMAGVDDGVRDRLTDFSTPVSGAWYFTPPVEVLRGLAG